MDPIAGQHRRTTPAHQRRPDIKYQPSRSINANWDGPGEAQFPNYTRCQSIRSTRLRGHHCPYRHSGLLWVNRIACATTEQQNWFSRRSRVSTPTSQPDHCKSAIQLCNIGQAKLPTIYTFHCRMTLVSMARSHQDLDLYCSVPEQDVLTDGYRRPEKSETGQTSGRHRS